MVTSNHAPSPLYVTDAGENSIQMILLKTAHVVQKYDNFAIYSFESPTEFCLLHNLPFAPKFQDAF